MTLGTQQVAKFDGRALLLGLAVVSGALMVAVGVDFLIFHNYALPLLMPFAWFLLVLSVFCCHVIVWILRLCFPPVRRYGRTVTLTPSFIMAVLTIVLPLYEELPSVQFNRMVLSPMPESVDDLRVGGADFLFTEHKIFRFAIAPKDFDLIASQKDFHDVSLTYEYSRCNELAREYTGKACDDLEPRVIYRWNQWSVDEHPGTSFEKVLMGNSSRNRAMFFYIFDN